MEIYYLNLENQFEVLPAVTNIECSLWNILFSAEHSMRISVGYGGPARGQLQKL